MWEQHETSGGIFLGASSTPLPPPPPPSLHHSVSRRRALTAARCFLSLSAALHMQQRKRRQEEDASLFALSASGSDSPDSGFQDRIPPENLGKVLKSCSWSDPFRRFWKSSGFFSWLFLSQCSADVSVLLWREENQLELIKQRWLSGSEPDLYHVKLNSCKLCRITQNPSRGEDGNAAAAGPEGSLLGLIMGQPRCR